MRSFTLTVVAVLTMASCSTSQSTLVPRTGGPAMKHSSAVVESVLYSFGSHVHDGARPRARLIDVKGKLYGTTFSGGTYHTGRVCRANEGCGAVFSLTPSGTETIVYGLFAGFSHGANPSARLIDVNGSDGQQPVAPLLAFNGKLYGTTQFGGAGGNHGTIFEITPAGKEHAIYVFNGRTDGYDPSAGLIASNGKLYGTAEEANSDPSGSIYALTPP